MSSKEVQHQRIKVPIKAILENDESNPNTDNDDTGMFHHDPDEGLFDYQPLNLHSFRQMHTLGMPVVTPLSDSVYSNVETNYDELDKHELDTINEISPKLRSTKKSRNFLNSHATFNRKNLQTILRMNKNTVKNNQQ